MNVQNHRLLAILAVGVALLTLGLQMQAAESQAKSIDKQYLLEKAPQRAAEVAAIRKDAKDQQNIVVVGRVGGRTNPWVKGTAAFSIVDRSLKACSELPGDTCPTPWDFCCEADLAKSTLLVMVHDRDGKIVKKDARELLGLKELDTVYVAGKTKRDKTGNVSIVASKFYVAGEKDKKQAAAAAKAHEHETAEKKETVK
jgi:hypothetical protein